MMDAINDLIKQAHQGSVVAIVEVLNYYLAESKVIIRAVFVGGILQLLCEGKQAEYLDKSYLVREIKDVLETIAPRKIRRVSIHSRVFNQHQLLWLEDILDSPDSELLWSENITIKKPHIWAGLPGHTSGGLIDSYPSQELVQKQQSSRGILIALISIIVLLIVGVFAFYQWMSLAVTQLFNSDYTSVKPTPNQTISDDVLSDEELFKQAVQLAENAVSLGRDAMTDREWLEIAKKWRAAADLMAAVSPSYPRYATAQNRVALYRRNQEIALSEARISR
ncbi:MAG: hypothetical protein P5680_23365 [Limnospira sp. PMC 737.11]|uniref:hypothetical protein n=1 Tax=Limnospira sp. PMC 737.11 TaxID=2981095 RepID=UPI0028E0FEA9|nr:hypothetical protein [Limnospira sp. PMC 737.11]MDT9277483.1 hypothetical protein [Limnospira sp. PMC 737.11]